MIQRLCRWTVVWAFCGGVLYAADVSAQEAASIVGRVTDESGAVLPGVTVTAKSPALQVGSATTVTDAQGDYRLTPLSIGTYEVDFELSGFQGVRREGVRLTVGFTARVDISLGVGALEEQITVTAVSPLVDVSSTTATTQFTREQLEVLPTSRNGLLSLMAQAPGVRGTLETGGAVTFSPPGTRVFGQGAEPWYVIEGVFTTSLQTEGAMGQYLGLQRDRGGCRPDVGDECRSRLSRRVHQRGHQDRRQQLLRQRLRCADGRRAAVEQYRRRPGGAGHY